MENIKTHRWQCMNCGEMADSYICRHCGKESYVKTDGDVNVKNSEKKIKTKSVKSDKKTLGESAQIYLAEVNSLKISLGNLIYEEFKKLKSYALGLFAVVVGLSIITAVLCSNIKTKTDTIEKKNEKLVDTIKYQTEKIEVLEKQIENFDKNDIMYIVHTVNAGETLETICEKYGINYSSDKNIIISINGIENPNVLKVGQTVILPQIK